MRRLLDIAFLLFIAMGCVGLDYYILKRDTAAQSYGVADYFAQRRADFDDILHPPSLANALPTQIEGWEIAANGADRIIGANAANRKDQASEIALVRAMATLTKASAPNGQMAGVTISKGETRLRVVATLTQSAADAAGVETSKQDLAPQADTGQNPMLNTMLQQASYSPDAAVYDIVDGVAFTELPAAAVTSDPDMRMMRATLTNALSVTVVTKSDDDAAIKQALQEIDFVMLNKLLNTPVAGVAEGRTTDVRADHPTDWVTTDGNRPDQPETAPQFAGQTKSVQHSTAIAQPIAPKSKATPAATAVFVAPPPTDMFGQTRVPCVRRAGILDCSDG